ncbi:MAG: shikimate kinase [Gammaproteobacteria bacterium]
MRGDPAALEGVPGFGVDENDSIIDLASGASPIVLIGLPGSGKSSIGMILASLLGRDFVDTDRVLQARFGQTIAAIIAQRGWSEFRRLESAVLLDALGNPNVVIASGGGVVELPANREAIKRQARVVWLQATQRHLLSRLAVDTGERPLLQQDPATRLAELAQAREPYYADLADYRIDTDTRSKRQVAEAIVQIIGGTTEKDTFENAD